MQIIPNPPIVETERSNWGQQREWLERDFFFPEIPGRQCEEPQSCRLKNGSPQLWQDKTRQVDNNKSLLSRDQYRNSNSQVTARLFSEPSLHIIEATNEAVNVFWYDR